MNTLPLVIYHDKCADGFGAAFSAWKHFGDQAEYMPLQHHDIDTIEHLHELTGVLDGQREVYVIDFSFSKQVMEALKYRAKKLVWLDHHKTSFDMWCGQYKRGDRFLMDNTDGIFSDARTPYYILLDDNKSGAMLAWEYFHPGTGVPKLIQHIDDGDRWIFNVGGTKEFYQALYSIQPWSFEQWDDTFPHVELSSHSYYVPSRLYSEGAAILRSVNQNVERAAKRALHVAIPNYNVDAAIVEAHQSKWDLRPDQALGEMAELYAVHGLAVNATADIASELGSLLAEKSGTFGLVWHVDGEGSVKCSLRSIGSYDVSIIAKSFGGGGHMNAAAFVTNIRTLTTWLSVIPKHTDGSY